VLDGSSTQGRPSPIRRPLGPAPGCQPVPDASRVAAERAAIAAVIPPGPSSEIRSLERSGPDALHQAPESVVGEESHSRHRQGQERHGKVKLKGHRLGCESVGAPPSRRSRPWSA